MFLIPLRFHSAPSTYPARSIPRNKHDLHGRKPTALSVSLSLSLSLSLTLPKRDKAYAAVIPNTSPVPAVVHPLSATALKKVNTATSPSLAFMLVTTYRTAILPTGNRLASAVANRAVTRRTDESQSANPSARRRLRGSGSRHHSRRYSQPTPRSRTHVEKGSESGREWRASRSPPPPSASHDELSQPFSAVVGSSLMLFWSQARRYDRSHAFGGGSASNWDCRTRA